MAHSDEGTTAENGAFSHHDCYYKGMPVFVTSEIADAGKNSPKSNQNHQNNFRQPEHDLPS